MFCNNCGKEVKENWKFCKYCGESLSEIISKEKQKNEEVKERFDNKKNDERVEEIKKNNSNDKKNNDINNIKKVYREPIKRINLTFKDIEKLKAHLKNNCSIRDVYNFVDENSENNKYICNVYISNELTHSPPLEYSIYYSLEKEYYFATHVFQKVKKEPKNKTNSENNNKAKIIIFVIAIIIGILIMGVRTGNYVTESPKDIAMAYIQNRLKDPSSFTVVDMSVKKGSNGTLVYIKYRAKNSFNAVVTEEQNVYLNENNTVTGSMYVE